MTRYEIKRILMKEIDRRAVAYIELQRVGGKYPVQFPLSPAGSWAIDFDPINLVLDSHNLDAYDAWVGSNTRNEPRIVIKPRDEQ